MNLCRAACRVALAFRLDEVPEHLASGHEESELSPATGVEQALRQAQVVTRGAELSPRLLPRVYHLRPAAGLQAFLGARGFGARTRPAAEAS